MQTGRMVCGQIKLEKLNFEDGFFNLGKTQILPKINIEQQALNCIEESRKGKNIVWPKSHPSTFHTDVSCQSTKQLRLLPLVTTQSPTSSNPSTTAQDNRVLSHKITLDNRAKMVDWMVQVYKVMGKSCPLTFFLGVSIMDRYFINKHRSNQIVNKSDLHIIGLCCLHISSKFEDVIPIYMSQVLLEIAHGKFSR